MKKKPQTSNSELLGFTSFLTVVPKHPKEIREQQELARRRHRKGGAKITKGDFHFQKKKKDRKLQKFTGVLDSSHGGPSTTAKSC